MSIEQSGKVVIYTKGYCPYCRKAKATLKELGLAFEEFDITFDRARAKAMRELSQRKTVPQIFIDDHHVGGNDDLQAAVKNGTLNKLLN